MNKISNRTLKQLNAKTKLALIEVERKKYENRILYASIGFSNRHHDTKGTNWRPNWIK